MQTIISEEIKKDPQLAVAIELVMEWLATKPGANSDPVKAEWSLIRDPSGRCLIKLALSDWTGLKETSFAPDEFNKEWRWQARLGQLWGAMLQARTRAEIKKLHEMVEQLEGD